jgi:hypothetical protein
MLHYTRSLTTRDIVLLPTLSIFQNVVGKEMDCLSLSLIKYRQAINDFVTTLENSGHDFNCEDFDGVVQALNQGSDKNKKNKLANP